MDTATNGCAFHDVRDPYKFARGALYAGIRRRGGHGLPERYVEDAVHDLVVALLVLSHRFDPSIGQSFSTYARRTLELRVIDWYRAEFADARYGEPPSLISYEEISQEPSEDGRRLGDALAAAAVDHPASVDPAFRGVLAGGNLTALAYLPAQHRPLGQGDQGDSSETTSSRDGSYSREAA